MIELKRRGEVCVLMLRHEGYLEGQPSTIFEQARPEDVAEVVAAGDPEITGLLNAQNWWRSRVTSERMRELEKQGAHLTVTLEESERQRVALDETVHKLSERLSKLQILWPAGMFTRDVARDEIDEDPEGDDERHFNELGLRRLALQRELEGAQQEAANLRAELEAEKRRSDRRVNAVTDSAVPVTDLEEERRIVRRIVRAATDLMRCHLGSVPIAGSGYATRLNDAIHDWIRCVEEGGWCNDQVEMRALNEHLEKRILGEQPEQEAAKALHMDQVSDATKRAGFRWPSTDYNGKPYEPGDRIAPPLTTKETLAGRAFGAALWLLDRIG